MKVGILTFHRAINYGAVLQAYALKETLRKLGHDVWIINYCGSRTEKYDRAPIRSNTKLKLLLHLHIRAFFNYDKNKTEILAKRQRFDDFLNKRLQLTLPCNEDSVPQDFDTYVVGSDQVWNTRICERLDPVFWGDFKRLESSRLISYAASTSVNDIKNNDENKICSLLYNYNAISVREYQVCDYINDHLAKHANLPEAKTVLDPTLLADKSIWNDFESIKYKNKKYVLYFSARGYKENRFVVRDKATNLAKKMQCEVVNINFNEDTPEDFVAKFKYASAVVTSSFHGVAFSLIFNRPLYAIMYGDEQDSRYVNVLRNIGAEQFLHSVTEELIPYTSLEYGCINSGIEKLRKESLTFLKESL